MPRWIEVPAYRVLEITAEEFKENYQSVNADGEPHRFGQQLYRIIRKGDGKLFTAPRFHYETSDVGRLIYLEEI